jgi:broad specificity phosphatase PhoE
MDLFIIRHGQSANNALPNLRNREVDPPLTDMGKRQAQVLAQHLAGGETHDLMADPAMGTVTAQFRRGFGITSLFSSAMYRSLETAQHIGRALGLAPRIWIDIHEEGGMYLDHGDEEGLVGYPGRTLSEILAEFPEFQAPPGIRDQGWWNRDHEDAASCAGRAIKVAKQLREMAGNEDRVAIVTHGAFIDALLKALFDQLPGGHIYYRHHNTAISRISIGPGARIEIRFLNRVDHLDPELVT